VPYSSYGMKDIKINLPICNQHDKSHEEAWAYRMCAPCSLWMVLKHHDSALVLTPVELREKLITGDGYLDNVGFKHQVMAEMGQKYGLPLIHARKFFYTPEEKEIGMKIINSNLQENHPVITSIFHHLNPSKGGHMVVVHGFQEFAGQTIGYYIQDPDASFRGHNYFLTRQEFLDGWRGGLIWSK